MIKWISMFVLMGISFGLQPERMVTQAKGCRGPVTREEWRQLRRYGSFVKTRRGDQLYYGCCRPIQVVQNLPQLPPPRGWDDQPEEIATPVPEVNK